MTRYELACDKRITLAAIVFEAAMLVSFVLCADALLEYLQIQTIMASHISLSSAVTAVLLCQYAIVATEWIARYRDDNRGRTIPIVLLPGGIILRALIMCAATVCVIAIKLLVYFISVLIAFIGQITRLDRFIGTSALVDAIDRGLEPIEFGVNCLYNGLYFNKIRANSSVFTAVFNSSLSLWCINH